MDVSNDTTLKALAAALQMRDLRQSVIASNIANADTPGYKAKRLEFEEALARAIDVDRNLHMKISNERHYNVGGGGFDNLQAKVINDPNGILSEDGNTVDRDSETARMVENKIQFDATVQLLNKKIGLMKYAISSDR